MAKKIFEKEWKALGTDVYVQIVDDGLLDSEGEKIFSDIKNIYAEQEKIFSRFDVKSELSKINSNLGKFIDASPDMLELAKKSLENFEESEGIFDPRILETLEKIGYGRSFSKDSLSSEENVGMIDERGKTGLMQDLIVENGRIKFLRKMDFSGIAKGYITDRVAEFLREKGFENFLVDSGGDMFAQGKDRSGDDWGIALEGSENEDETVLEISGQAVATSGSVRRNWERGGKKFHHIINPHRMDDFSFELQSVTVVAETVERADVWAKVLFLLGLESGLEKAREKEMKAVFLKQDKKMVKSEYFDK